MDHRQLRYFLALADHLHFGNAAKAVHLAQPSLSRQIAGLEDDLGCTLVIRNSRSVALTAAGQELQRHARKVLAGIESAIQATRAVARGERGELKIAFTSMIAWTAFPRLIKAFASEFPGITLSLNELLPGDLVNAVASGENDLCLSFKASVAAPLRYRALHSETLCMAIPSEHPLAENATLSVAQLSREPFIVSPRSTAPLLFDSIMGLCQRAAFDPEVRMYTHLQGTIINLVAEGLGVAIVPSAMAKSSRQGVRFYPIQDSPGIEIGMVWSDDNHNPCLPAFVDKALAQ